MITMSYLGSTPNATKRSRDLRSRLRGSVNGKLLRRDINGREILA